MTRKWVVAMAAALLAMVSAARAGVATTRMSVAGKTLAVDGEKKLVTVDLSSLPKGAKVVRADLWLGRTEELTGLHDEAMTPLRVYSLRPGEANRRDVDLGLRGPWFDRFDATEAVQRWLGGKERPASAAIQVRDFPLWAPDATRLDLWLEGEGKDVPTQVTGVAAVHRAGQTFITFKETEDLVGADEIAWGEMKKITDALDGRREVRYLVFRAAEPITAANVHQAEHIATVKPLSGWNLNGRSFDRGVDKYIATAGGIMVGHWNPFTGGVDGRFGVLCPMDRLAIPDGKASRTLERTTGLYVHTVGNPPLPREDANPPLPREDANPPLPRGAVGKACYAVCTSVDGVVNLKDIGKANAVGPVDEKPGVGEPVLQREMEKMPFFNYPQKRLHYVRWVAPPMANVPSEYYNWSVGVPDDLGKKVPLELNLHRDGNDYWRTHYRVETDSIVLCPHDFPVKTWWYGCHEALGTLKSWRDGTVQPYTERRLLAFVEWACKAWPIDGNRILVTGCRGGAGGSGPLHLGLRHPDVFNMIVTGHPVVDYAETCAAEDKRSVEYAGQMQRVWGNVKWDGRTDEGKNLWAEHDMVVRAAALPPDATVPLLTIGYSYGDARTRQLMHTMLAKRLGVIANFTWGGARYIPVSRTGTYPNVIRLDVARDKPMLSFRNAGAVSSVARRQMGSFNGHLRWKDLKDAGKRFEVTLYMQGRGDAVAEVTLRRPQAFRPAAGKTYAWSNTGGDDRRKIEQSGEVTVGDDRLLTIPNVQFSTDGTKLVIQAK